MKTLEDIYIENDLLKAAYIKRVGVPGHYRYYYNQLKKKLSKKFYAKYGKEVKHRGDIMQTLKNVLKGKSYALNVFKVKLPVLDFNHNTGKRHIVKDENGVVKTMNTSIDVFYGTEGQGLYHTVKKHYATQNDYESIDECLQAIMNSINELQQCGGRGVKFEQGHKFIFTDSKNNRLLFQIEFEDGGVSKKDGVSREIIAHCFLTSYDVDKNKGVRKREREEIAKRNIELEKFKKNGG